MDLGPSRGHFNIPWGRSIFRDIDWEFKVIQNSDTLDLWQEFVSHHSPQLTQFLSKAELNMRVKQKKFVAVILIMFNIVFKMEIYFLFLYSTKVLY